MRELSHHKELEALKRQMINFITMVTVIASRIIIVVVTILSSSRSLGGNDS
uniref:Uncharacterized protein n=1 Tax=Anguilla anguilla TaxID=7936 RepID=A0A0E9VIW8_ANGAN